MSWSAKKRGDMVSRVVCLRRWLSSLRGAGRAMVAALTGVVGMGLIAACSTAVSVPGGEAAASGPGGSGGGDPGPCPDSSCRSLTCDTSSCAIDPKYQWLCGDAELCHYLEFAPPSDPVGANCNTKALTLAHPEDANCLIEALRSGTIGVISWGYACVNAEPEQHRRVLDIRPGRAGLFRAVVRGFWTQVRKIGPAKLRDADYFSGCLNKTGVDVWNCLEAWSEGCGS